MGLRKYLAKGVLAVYQEFWEGKYEPRLQVQAAAEPEYISRRDIEERKTRIVHISDLHIGRHDEQKLAHLRNALGPIAPHFVVISGDIVHDPRSKFLEDASNVLKELGRIGKELLVVPGNHDRHGEVALEHWAKQIGAGASPAYQCKIYELSDRRFVFFFLLNSTLADAPTWVYQQIHDLIMVRGWIDRAQLEWLRKMFQHIRGRYQTEYARGLKIAVLHHHLIPVGPEGYLSEAFMTLGNSNEVLGLLADMKIDLVLHGHKHWPAIRTHTMKERSHRFIILSAGTATAYSGEELAHPEEETAKMSDQCSFFSLEVDADAIAVYQYNYCNRLDFPKKFLITQGYKFEREAPQTARMEISMCWTIHFPSTDWSVVETYVIEGLSEKQEKTFNFVLGCTKQMRFSDLRLQVRRLLNGKEAGAILPKEDPEATSSVRDGETAYYFRVPIELNPPLARRLEKDELTIQYTVPEGFFEFKDQSFVDGTWGFPFSVDKLTLTVRFTGSQKLKALRVLAPRQKTLREGQPEGGGGLTCEVEDLPSEAQITYILERQ